MMRRTRTKDAWCRKSERVIVEIIAVDDDVAGRKTHCWVNDGSCSNVLSRRARSVESFLLLSYSTHDLTFPSIQDRQFFIIEFGCGTRKEKRFIDFKSILDTHLP